MISVLIASRLEKRPNSKQLFVERAIETIRDQRMDCQVIVGVDPGQSAKLDAEVVESPRANLSAVLNAAAERIEGEYVAILEDDDEWLDGHLAASFGALGTSDFVSGTQIVVNESGEVHHVNDFPCPNTWLMQRSVWDAVGGFSEEYPVHQDHDWLGRLNQLKVKRSHLVEATAPNNINAANLVRPWLAVLCALDVSLVRHSAPWPLVKRLSRSGSWTGQILGGSQKSVSDDCMARIAAKYGYFPW